MSAGNPESQEEYDAEVARLAAEEEENRQAESDTAAAEVEHIPTTTPCGFEALKTAISHIEDLIILHSGGHVRQQLLTLPDKIKIQSLAIADLTTNIEKLRLSIANIKNQALELVLNATLDGKPKYGNDKARNLAVESILKEDKLYQDNLDALGRTEVQCRYQQIELEYLQNQFRAYLAIASRG